MVWPDINFTEVAEAVQVSHSHLCNIVAGKCRPSIEVAIRLARVWGRIVGRKVTVEGLAKEFGNQKTKGKGRKAK